MTGGTEAEGWAEDLARAGESIWARKGEPVTVTHGEPLVLPADEFAAVKAVNTAWETAAGARLSETHVLVRRDDLDRMLNRLDRCDPPADRPPGAAVVHDRLSAAVEAGQ